MEGMLAGVLIDGVVMLISIASALGIGAVLLVGVGSFVSVNNPSRSIPQQNLQQRP
jgi:hypothetical protein